MPKDGRRKGYIGRDERLLAVILICRIVGQRVHSWDPRGSKIPLDLHPRGSKIVLLNTSILQKCSLERGAEKNMHFLRKSNAKIKDDRWCGATETIGKQGIWIIYAVFEQMEKSLLKLTPKVKQFSFQNELRVPKCHKMNDYWPKL